MQSCARFVFGSIVRLSHVSHLRDLSEVFDEVSNETETLQRGRAFIVLLFNKSVVSVDCSAWITMED